MITGPWNLTDLKDVPKNGKKVFSCFSCGGGSTMGYKLAGYEVLGCVEIDPRMLNVYKANHNPKYPFEMGVQQFNNLPYKEIPQELFDLDILDGSPPCSSFSMAGTREKTWGKNKKFKEGQAEQILDDLFFEFIKTVKTLRPKVAVAENVKGLLLGNAKGYIKQISDGFIAAGYDIQLFLLNAAFMGVPQRRERTFFIARRRDLNLPKIEMKFEEKLVTPKDVSVGINPVGKPLKSLKQIHLWKRTHTNQGMGIAGGFDSQKKISELIPSLTQTASTRHWHWSEPALISDPLVIRLQTFPDDFNFLNMDPQYICGMSVPPFMMQRVSMAIYDQWLKTKHILRKASKQSSSSHA